MGKLFSKIFITKFKINRNIPIFNSDDAWINILHQLILFIIIIGRWMLPKAKGVTRDQLSQILLIFIGVGADILEFVTETIKVEIKLLKMS